MTTLIAYERGKYVDSITTDNPQFLAEFREDFKMCKVVEE